MGSALFVEYHWYATHSTSHSECLTPKHYDDEEDHPFRNHSGVDSQHSGRIVVIQLPHIQYACYQRSSYTHSYIDVYHRVHHHERRLPSVAALCFCFSWPCDVSADGLNELVLDFGAYSEKNAEMVSDNDKLESIDVNVNAIERLIDELEHDESKAKACQKLLKLVYLTQKSMPAQTYSDIAKREG